MDSKNDSDILKPGETIKPTTSKEDVPDLVRTYYGLSVTKVNELNAYDDRNFYIEANGKKFIFKVLNSMDSKKTNKIEAEIAAMTFLNSRGINCPTLVDGIDGSNYYKVDLPAGNGNPSESEQASNHVIRLLNFVPGKIMPQVLPTYSLLCKVGSEISKIGVQLKDFSHVGFLNHSSIWMVSHIPDLNNFIHVIEDQPERYKVVKDVMKSFEENVIPLYPELETGIIHGDFNEQNILLEVAEENQNEYNICGVIDFGDMHSTFLVFDLGITMCYMMLECMRTKDIDPIIGSAHILVGYNKHRKVPLKELKILRTLIAGRLCQSLVMGAYSYSLDPSNEYLLTTAKSGWDLLLSLWNNTDEIELRNIWMRHLDN